MLCAPICVNLFVCSCFPGKVYSLGRTEYGRLGLGENCKESYEPAQIPDLGDEVVTAIGCGSSVSLACTQKGKY